jgi:hypothetical protein
MSYVAIPSPALPLTPWSRGTAVKQHPPRKLLSHKVLLLCTKPPGSVRIDLNLSTDKNSTQASAGAPPKTIPNQTGSKKKNSGALIFSLCMTTANQLQIGDDIYSRNESPHLIHIFELGQDERSKILQFIPTRSRRRWLTICLGLANRRRAHLHSIHTLLGLNNLPDLVLFCTL